MALQSLAGLQARGHVEFGWTASGTWRDLRAGGKGGRNGFEPELRRLGAMQKNGRPNHPQTQGKVERFQRTLPKNGCEGPP
jgi:transposase InsO family protein